jgi:hypothetical protein
VSAARGRGKSASQVRLVIGDVVEEGEGGGEEEIAGYGAAEIEKAVVVAGWAADEHVFEHLFERGRGAAVAEEIGAEFAVGGASEGHIVAQNFYFFAVFFR